MNIRQQFLRQFFSEIESIDYTLLKFIDRKIEDLDIQSNLEILVTPDAIPYLKSMLQNTEEVKNMDSTMSSSMEQFFISFQDGSFLQINFLFKLIRKNTVYLSNELIRDNTIVKDGIKCCNDYILFEQLMIINQLNREGMPNKYCAYFAALPLAECESVLVKFNHKYHSGFSMANINTFDPVFRSQLKNYISLLSDNALAENFKNTINYGRERVSKFWRGREKASSAAGMNMAGGRSVMKEAQRMAQ